MEQSSATPSVRVHPARIQAEGWGWRHASRTRWALRDIDLVIEPGERVLLLGASGAGKSTLMQALAGVLGGSDEGESEGSLLVDDQPPHEGRGRAGLVLQDPDSQVILAKVGDDVAFGCENLGVPREEIWPRVRRALDDVGLDVALDRSTSQLSGGQKQRLALAGVLAMRPGLLLLDEPTANLDPMGVIEVRDAVARVLDATGATFVVVEHRVDVWLPLVDRVIVISADGGVAADGLPDDVLRARARELADSGVWVPGHPPAFPARHGLSEMTGTSQMTGTSGAMLLAAHDLTVGRGGARWMSKAKREASGGGGDGGGGDGSGAFSRTNLNVEISAGTTTTIIGSNGAGKTTLGLTLAGLLPPIAGAVKATELLRQGAGERPILWKSRELLTRIGTVFQEPEHQFLRSTVREELAVGPRALKIGDAEIASRVDELLQRLRLDTLAAANPFTLSGGEKRRLSVATVLAARPKILVLDEPTFGQDSRTWRELVALLAELVGEGRAIVAMTHDQLFIDALADREVHL